MLIFFQRMPLTLRFASFGHGHVGPPDLQGFIYSTRKTRSPSSNFIDVANQNKRHYMTGRVPCVAA